MKLGIIGGGQMAGAIIKGIIESERVRPEHIIVSDVEVSKLKQLSQAYAIKTTASNLEVVAASEVIILAVKPHILSQVLKEIDINLKSNHILISIAAGITTDLIQQVLSTKVKIVRIMPNTACLIGKGVSALCLGFGAGPEEQQLVRTLFASLGDVVLVNEEDMNAVTALSGSGPAYVYLFIETLIDAGVKMGLSRVVARHLAIGTVSGGAEMLKQSGKHPAELKDMVTSPGGTTIAALLALEEHGFRHSIISGVLAAEKRAQELRF